MGRYWRSRAREKEVGDGSGTGSVTKTKEHKNERPVSVPASRISRIKIRGISDNMYRSESLRRY